MNRFAHLCDEAVLNANVPRDFMVQPSDRICSVALESCLPGFLCSFCCCKGLPRHRMFSLPHPIFYGRSRERSVVANVWSEHVVTLDVLFVFPLLQKLYDQLKF